MKKIVYSLLLIASVAGCGGYALTVGDPEGVVVADAPPPLRVEVARECGSRVWAPGWWNHTGRSYSWVHGDCIDRRPGYVYVPPRYDRGVYYRAHWGAAPVVVRSEPRYEEPRREVPPPAVVRVPEQRVYVAPPRREHYESEYHPEPVVRTPPRY